MSGKAGADGYADVGARVRWVACADHEIRMAMGYAGQTLIVVPDLEVVVVANARWRGMRRSARAQSGEIRGFLFRRLPELLGIDIGVPGECSSG
ncbi:MAG: hypothetical protein KJO65_10315 [Gemmatimonadetes bacterium]|nr:hypothetical protein [Gemmatimonadota bacterium]